MAAPNGATWRSGYATVCKTVYPGSIPGVASIDNNFLVISVRLDSLGNWVRHFVRYLAAFCLGMSSDIAAPAILFCSAARVYSSACLSVRHPKIAIS